MALKDGGHVIIDCGDCRESLVDIWIVDPDARDRDGAPLQWTGVAECCFCGGRSFPTTWQGRFQHGGVGVPNPDDPDDSFVRTTVTNVAIEGDQLRFQTARGPAAAGKQS
jgi:hypothetical protein